MNRLLHTFKSLVYAVSYTLFERAIQQNNYCGEGKPRPSFIDNSKE